MWFHGHASLGGSVSPLSNGVLATAVVTMRHGYARSFLTCISFANTELSMNMERPSVPRTPANECLTSFSSPLEHDGAWSLMTRATWWSLCACV